MHTHGAALDRIDTQALAPAVYCTGRRPDAAGGWARAYEGGTSAQRRGWLLLLGSCDVAPGPMQLLGWCASTAPPASTALPSRPLGSPGCGSRRAEEWPRPRPVPPPERLRLGWVTAPARPRSRRTRRLGRVTRPGARLRAAGRAQPSHHGAWKVGGTRAPQHCPPRDPRREASQPTHTSGETRGHHNLNASKTCRRTAGSRMCI